VYVVLAEKFRVRPLVDAGDGEGAAGSGGRFFEQQRDILSLEGIAPYTRPLFAFRSAARSSR